MELLRRSSACLLLLFALGSVSLSAQERRVGRVVQAAPQVTGRLAGQKIDLKQHPEVFLRMEVETTRRAGARIAINPDLKQQQGMVALGPRTIVELTEHFVNQALGLEKMSLLVKLGQFRLALLPPPPGSDLEEGEYLITTPGGTKIRLRGTDVAVQVDRDGTVTVWVLEGEVEVTAAAGEMRRVPAGYRTRVRPGRGPEPPVRFGPSEGPGPGVFPHPGETIFPDPPGLNLRAIRLDLPQ
jgi:hypothetical protein